VGGHLAKPYDTLCREAMTTGLQDDTLLQRSRREWTIKEVA